MILFDKGKSSREAKMQFEKAEMLIGRKGKLILNNKVC